MLQFTKSLLKLGYTAVRVIHKAFRLFRSDERVAIRRREEGLSQLNLFSRQHEAPVVPAARKILVDGTWDNANYWTRLAIVRRSLALDAAVEVGVIGRYSRKKSISAFSAFGITEIIDLQGKLDVGSHLIQAKILLKHVKCSDDLMHLRLPNDFPPELFFDGVLKRQRRATLNVTDPKLPEYLAEAMAFLEVAEEIITESEFDLVILSHALDFTYGAIAWAAIRHGLTVITLYGDFGHAKFLRLNKKEDLFAYPERPRLEELNDLPEEKIVLLRTLGAQQLAARLDGKTTDVGAIYAYQRRKTSTNRKEIVKRFGWEVSKPIIGIYNSNWFDYPHSSGLKEFRDFLDWIEATLRVAKERPEVNWLFKAHPCDDWYGKINGDRLEDLVAAINQPHIRMADKSWNGLDLMRSLDGIVTCHGTIGIEATAQLIPVLVPYVGWYGHAGFITCANSREDYLSKLQTPWWHQQDMISRRERAELFAGWMFCVPDWHNSYNYSDDSRQDEIYLDLQEFLQSNRAALDRESNEVRAWFANGHPYFHIFAMTRAEGFRLGNCRT